VACPADEAECRQLLTTAFEQNHPVAVRYPRGSGVGVAVPAHLEALPYGKGEIRRRGRGVAILAFGTLLYPGLKAAEALNATVVNMRWAKPLDVELLLPGGARTRRWSRWKRAASWAARAVRCWKPCRPRGKNLCVLPGPADVFIEHGDPAKLLALQGLDAAGMEASRPVGCLGRSLPGKVVTWLRARAQGRVRVEMRSDMRRCFKAKLAGG
jgi:1-deoxy-D-xylulose-5-phosphate synthase